jgi:diacylglycerol O-acyltransferase / trehalose O-mycolyltransferase / mycolyltransferase Ag85
VLTRRQVDDRTWDLLVDSPAVGRAVTVRLLLPTRFDAAPAQRWPVLYLFHGCCDSYVAWTRSTDVAALTRPFDVLVAMPEGGDVGFYSDWRFGPGWEAFHTGELPALLAAEYGPGTGPSWPACPWAGSARWATPPATPAGTPPPRRSAGSRTPACPPR